MGKGEKSKNQEGMAMILLYTNVVLDQRVYDFLTAPSWSSHGWNGKLGIRADARRSA